MKTWPTKKLGEVLTEIKNGTTATQNKQNLGYPVTRIETVQNFSIDKDRIAFVELPIRDFEKYKLENGDILFSHINSEEHLGKVAIYSGQIKNLVLGMNLLRLRVNKKLILSRFLYYFFLTGNAKKQIKKNAKRAVNQASINQAQIKKFLIFAPPLQIQKQIVERMDKIAEAQKLNDELIQKSDELFQSLLHKELNPTGKSWEVQKLGNIIKPQYGYTASAKDSGEYRFIRITDISDEGELRDSDKKYVTLSQNEAENYQLRRGDLLLARTGATFGKILFFNEDEPSMFASYLIRLNPNTLIVDPFYIWLFSRSQNYWWQARSLMTGSGQPQFNANKLKQIKIPLPSLEIQKQIVEKLSAAQEYKKQLLSQKLKLKELFDSVLDKSMKGELDINDQ